MTWTISIYNYWDKSMWTFLQKKKKKLFSFFGEGEGGGGEREGGGPE